MISQDMRASTNYHYGDRNDQTTGSFNGDDRENDQDNEKYDPYLTHNYSGYENNVNDNNNNNNNKLGGSSNVSRLLINDPTSPYYDLDPQLVGFIQKHNVVLDDGAVVNQVALLNKAALNGKMKKKFKPPCNLILKHYILLILGIIFLMIIVIVSLAVGLTLGFLVRRPDLPHASPWWRRSFIYQLNVATWANDVGGPVGRLQDVIPRLAYLSSQVGSNAILITNLIASDVNGVIDFNRVSQDVDPDGEAFTTLLPQLVEKSKKPLGHSATRNQIQILLGAPLYSTSTQHAWFQSSQVSASSLYASFYLWTSEAPATAQDQRHYAYNVVRKAYYRHVHGKPNSPLLNLTNRDVQTQLKNVVQFWREKLAITGLMITNSSNVMAEMVPGIRSILNAQTDETFIWLADDPQADKMINPGEKVCHFRISINMRVPTRTSDLNAQIMQAMNDTRLRTCSPIWTVSQLSDDDKDFETTQRLAYFLPGNFMIMAGQEVDLSTGGSELIEWSFGNYLSYETYWPNNIMLKNKGRHRLDSWRNYWLNAQKVSLLHTEISLGTLRLFVPTGSENLLAIYREYTATKDRIYFVVSFQTLNTVVRFRSIFFDMNSPLLEVAYDSKNVFKKRRKFGDEALMNNQVLLLYLY